jgi:Domain of unknown function (DUF4169)
MAETVNLRLARKRRQREAADAAAAQNRVTFGLSKAGRAQAAAGETRAAAAHAGHLRDRTPGVTGDDES